MQYKGFLIKPPTSTPPIPSRWIECVYAPTLLERLRGYEPALSFDITPTIRIEQWGRVKDEDLYRIAKLEIDHYFQIPAEDRPVFLPLYVQGPDEGDS